MCKVAGVTHVTDENRDDVWVFMQLLAELISLGNDDGLGYASFDKAGNVFGEKWLINKTAFKDLTQIKKMNAEKMSRIYTYFGDKVVKDEAQAIILHTRAATCGKGIENTHPFINDTDKPTVAIIHNGMIYNHQKFPRKYSTCDSEVIAHLYEANKVGSSISKLNEFTEEMQGWFTVLALSKDDSGKMVMDAFSDSGRLGSYFIKELNTRIYSTYADDVAKVARSLGLTPVDMEQIKPDTAFRIDVLTGEQIEFSKIKTLENVPVTIYNEENWTGWPNVTVMEGNMSDEAFRNRFFAGGRFGGHHRD
jgi:predicted glutamine amidotransferase